MATTDVEVSIKGKKLKIGCGKGETFANLFSRIEAETGHPRTAMRCICLGAFRKTAELVEDVASTKKTKVLKCAITLMPVQQQQQQGDGGQKSEEPVSAGAAPVLSPLEAATKSVVDTEGQLVQLREDYALAEKAGKLGKERGKLGMRGKRIQEQVTVTLITLDSIAVTPESRPLRRALIRRLDQVSKDCTDLNIQ